jgi:hypothetical protein
MVANLSLTGKEDGNKPLTRFAQAKTLPLITRIKLIYADQKIKKSVSSVFTHVVFQASKTDAT